MAKKLNVDLSCLEPIDKMALEEARRQSRTFLRQEFFLVGKRYNMSEEATMKAIHAIAMESKTNVREYRHGNMVYRSNQRGRKPRWVAEAIEKGTLDTFYVEIRN